MKTLEICCTSLEAALAAQAGGAQRIELCIGLELDGLTPSAGLLSLVKSSISIPVFVLIRPRGGSFFYTEEEISVMISDIEHAHQLGADGIVSGALSADGSLHFDHTRRLVEASGALPFTFHRAFDVCTNPFDAIDKLINLGVKRILTSGQEANALSGAEVLRQFDNYAAGRLLIMAGGGIRSNNITQIAADTQLQEFHSSARPAGAKDTEVEEVKRLFTALQ